MGGVVGGVVVCLYPRGKGLLGAQPAFWNGGTCARRLENIIASNLTIVDRRDNNTYNRAIGCSINHEHSR